MIHKLTYDNECYCNDTKNTAFSGAYGRIFVNEKKTKAIKVFYKGDDLSKKRQKHILETFNSETSAYDLAYSDNELMQYIPRYYGRVKIDNITDDKDSVVDEDYYIKCAFQIEFIKDRFIKLGNQSFTNRDIIISMFERLNINNTIDASVVIEKNKSIFKVIDFSMKDIKYYI